VWEAIRWVLVVERTSSIFILELVFEWEW
jgi:hypothetical protein